MDKYKALFDKLKEEDVYYEDYISMISGKVNKISFIVILGYLIGVLLFRKYVSKESIMVCVGVIIILTQIVKKVIFNTIIPKRLNELMNSKSEEFNKAISYLKEERKTRAKNLCMERYILGAVKLEEVASWLNIDKSKINYMPNEDKPRRIEVDSDKVWFEFIYESNDLGAMLSFECLSTQVDDALISSIADINTILVEFIEDGNIVDTLIDKLDEEYSDSYEGEVSVKGNNCIAKVSENIIYNGDNKINYKIEITYR